MPFLIHLGGFSFSRLEGKLAATREAFFLANLRDSSPARPRLLS